MFKIPSFCAVKYGHCMGACFQLGIHATMPQAPICFGHSCYAPLLQYFHIVMGLIISTLKDTITQLCNTSIQIFSQGVLIPCKTYS